MLSQQNPNDQKVPVPFSQGSLRSGIIDCYGCFAGVETLVGGNEFLMEESTTGNTNWLPHWSKHTNASTQCNEQTGKLMCTNAPQARISFLGTSLGCPGAGFGKSHPGQQQPPHTKLPSFITPSHRHHIGPGFYVRKNHLSQAGAESYIGVLSANQIKTLAWRSTYAKRQAMHLKQIYK